MPTRTWHAQVHNAHTQTRPAHLVAHGGEAQHDVQVLAHFVDKEVPQVLVGVEDTCVCCCACLSACVLGNHMTVHVKHNTHDHTLGMRAFEPPKHTTHTCRLALIAHSVGEGLLVLRGEQVSDVSSGQQIIDVHEEYFLDDLVVGHEEGDGCALGAHL